MKRRDFLNIASKSFTGTLALSGGATFYASQIEPAWIDITTFSLPLPDLVPAFHGYRIVHITDIHSDGEWMDYARLLHTVRLVNEQQPDVVVITGDFVTSMIPIEVDSILAALRFLRARDGVFAVLGNHDHWSNSQDVRGALQANGVCELNDVVHTIYRNGAMFHIVGLDDLMLSHESATPEWLYKMRLEQVLRTVPSQGPAILLVHEPDLADVTAIFNRISLQLSGHSHGGQVRLPLYGPLVLPLLAHKYSAGLYSVNGMLHYTNRGIGMIPPYVRFNCRPEIAVFTCCRA